MRIRRAEKLLGCTSEYRTASPAPMPLDSAAAIVAAAGLLCELNRSSLVDDSINLGLSNHQREAKLEDENEEEEMSVVRNGLEAKEEEEEDEEEEEEEGVEEKLGDKMEQMRKRKEKGTEAASGVIKCKKTDGKGWHCRRDAQIPHSLCSYHLTQLRSYRARFEDQLSGDGNGGRKNRRKKSAAAVETPGASSNYCYYYYSILGPWWGKRRGPLNEHEVGNESSESNDKSEIAPQELNGKTDHEALADVDNGDDDEEDDGGSCCNVTYKTKKKPLKKRGRKPVKARSLKSLL